MTVTDRTAATEQEFAARIAPFESAPTPPEVREAAVLEEVRERVRRLVFDHEICDDENGKLFADRLDDVLRDAAAAVAAYRAQDGGAEEAVRRVEALCDVADDQPDGYECQFFATQVLRDAIAGELR